MQTGLYPVKKKSGRIPVQSVLCSGSFTEDMGVITVTQKYRNPYATDERVRFGLPLSSGLRLLSLSAESDRMQISTQVLSARQAEEYNRQLAAQGYLVSGLPSSMHGFDADLGVLPANGWMTVVARYYCSCPAEGGYRRLTLPLLLPSDLGQLSMGLDVCCTVALDLTYRGASDLISVTSPTHDLTVQRDDRQALIRLGESLNPYQDILIDIQEMGNSEPTLYYNENFARYCFASDEGEKEQSGAEYLFLLDPAMDRERLERGIGGVRAALRNRAPKDKIILTSCGSDGALWLEPESLAEAEEWLSALTDQKKGSVSAAVRRCAESEKTRYVLAWCDRVPSHEEGDLQFAEQFSHTVFYTFSETASFWSKLAAESGGEYTAVKKSDPADMLILHQYTALRMAWLRSAAFSFDGAIGEICPKSCRQLRRGERVVVTGHLSGSAPEIVTVTGEADGKRIKSEITFSNTVFCGEELEPFCVLHEVDSLELQPPENPIQEEMQAAYAQNLAVSHQIVCGGAAVALCYRTDNGQRVIPQVLPPRQRPPRPGGERLEEERFFLKLALSQREDGSFSGGADDFLHTAKIIQEFCYLCGHFERYDIQVRRGVCYLLERLEASEDAYIAPDPIRALRRWLKKTGGGTDEVVKKAEALVYLHEN